MVGIWLSFYKISRLRHIYNKIRMGEGGRGYQNRREDRAEIRKNGNLKYTSSREISWSGRGREGVLDLTIDGQASTALSATHCNRNLESKFKSSPGLLQRSVKAN